MIVVYNVLVIILIIIIFSLKAEILPYKIASLHSAVFFIFTTIKILDLLQMSTNDCYELAMKC